MTPPVPNTTALTLAGIRAAAAAEPTKTPDFSPAVRAGSLVFTSGQLPLSDGELVATGLLGRDVTVAEGARLARICTVNAFAALSELVDFADIERVVKLNGFVASAPGFHDQAAVMNGASSLLNELFAGARPHARTAIGVAALPRNAPVEVELVVRLGGATA